MSTAISSRLISFVACFVSIFAFSAMLSGGLDCAMGSERSLWNSDSPQKVEFQAVKYYSGRKGNGAQFSAGTYDSTDGKVVSSTVETYRSATRAKSELKKRIKKATEIVERGSKRNRNGKLIGYRVVVMLRGGSQFGTYATVLWLAGEELHIIESSSLQHALEFERQFYK
jgi:hypothetical protein